MIFLFIYAASVLQHPSSVSPFIRHSLFVIRWFQKSASLAYIFNEKKSNTLIILVHTFYLVSNCTHLVKIKQRGDILSLIILYFYISNKNCEQHSYKQNISIPFLQYKQAFSYFYYILSGL